jgi:hypothetical protein
MPVQSEAALENGLIDTLQKMNYEYVHIEEEKNLSANFKKQLEKHNKKKLEELGRTEFTESEFEKILIYLEGGTRFEKAKKLRDLFPLELESGERLWVEFLNGTHWCQNEFQVSNQITVEGRKKCRKEDDNILFIDASKEFEKVKTQNKLRPQHIKKIVDTYRERKEIEKYSHLATLQEVAENDYNLNIPRYVDTFEEEEPIDIHAVMKEIKDLEAKRADLDKEIEGYLKELGLVE